MRDWIIAALILASGVQALSQAPLRFEVASVKPRAPVGPSASVGLGGGGSLGRKGERFIAVDRPLRDIIHHAFAMEFYEVVERGPGWLDDHFDITAVIPQAATQVDADRTMLQTLLAERFRLQIRWSTREIPVYALVPARRDGRLGPSLKPSTTDCRNWRRPQFPAAGDPPLTPEQLAQLTKLPCDMSYYPFRAQIVGGGRTIDDLVQILSRIPAVRAPVINRTSLTGPFDFELQYAPDPSSPIPGADQQPSLFVAIEEQLGLKLESSRGPVRSLVITRIERPTPD